MQKEFIDNLNTYISCFSDGESRNKEFIDFLNKYQHHKEIWHFLYEVRFNLKSNDFDSIVKILSLGFFAIELFKEKETSDKEHWVKIRRLEKQRKNITPYINGLKHSLELYECINDHKLIKHTKIAISIFESFLADDDLTIEKLSLAHFMVTTLRHGSKEYDEETGIYKDIPFDPHHLIEEKSGVRNQIKQFIPEVEPLIKSYEDVVYLASILNFFEGYRIKTDMILKSIAIKLYNYPLWVNPHRLNSINKSALKRSIENLLSQYSDTEKFSFDYKKAKNFYVKTYFHSSPILALEGKNNKGKFQSLFNPEQYYSALKNDPEKYNSEKVILNSMFFTN
ncbi:MAG: hypothetical protein JU82_05905 [Sulfuricurvum sp. MLSB]|uniref:hypothetical protein n=1 Tax=unclassified Sulfuricurvum TaxID=2632390 RepID=UPI0005072B0D|nr:MULTISPECIES: hypothetical protein [unclassified Sulfuricurvum]KFN39777.1 MAG: hypothetical protein JU82_05905 [Sulfuricurvum sp. MLSB]